MELKSITFKSTNTDKDKYIEIASVAGSINTMFHVFTNKRLTCQIFQTAQGWGWFLPPKTELQSGDLYALIEIIEYYWQLNLTE